VRALGEVDVHTLKRINAGRDGQGGQK
jgi:hypothetical protein